MSQLHKINQASIECDFTAFADAETFESRAAQWVVQQLLPVVETVFDDVCPEHQTLVIDTLTLDLGELSPKTFYEQAPEKLKQELQDQLRSQLHIATTSHTKLWATHAKPKNKQTDPEPHKMVVLSQQQQRWNVLWQFLSTGILPWTVPGEQSLEALGLSDILTEHSTKLINALNNTNQPEKILRRVVEQFPITSIAALFKSLTPAYQWEIMSLLLAHPKSHTGELTDQLAQAWYTRFTQLLTQHNLVPLRTDWEKIIHQFAPQLIKALYQRHTDSQLPRNLVRDLNETERLLLLSVLTPQEYPFLTAILRAPDLWQMKSQPDINQRMDHVTQALNQGESITTLPQSQIHQHLWLFTLHYLLIDRGSAFNRQSYMSGLVIQMANSQNQTVDALLASLISATSSTTIDSTLRAQLLGLLHTIQPVIASPALLNAHIKPQIAETLLPSATISDIHLDDTSQPRSHAPLRHINELVIALCSGQENQLMQYWPNNLQPFAALLRWCGQLDYVRRHWSETYSDKTLLALADVLEPLATHFIRILVVEKRLFTPQKSATTTERISLWKFTFAFLIVERGGAFNQKNYLHYLIQQMASRRNVSYADLLEEILNNVVNDGDFSLAGVTMRSLLEDLAPASRPEKSGQDEQYSSRLQSPFTLSLISPLSFAQMAGIEDIIATLHSANQTQWNSCITQWQHDYGKQLPLIIRDLGLSLSVLKRWVAHFDNVALFTITAIINPHAKETVHTIFNESQTIGTAIRHTSSPLNSTNTRNALWELTLHYLISRRGSEFNQYQYLLSITEQLSARYQIKTEVLIHEWLNLSDSGFLWRQQLIDLVEHHKQPPVTAPRLLANIQSATNASVLSQQQRALLQHYAAINVSAMATQLQTWNTAQLARVVRTMQPQLSECVIALLPLLLSIVHHFKLASHWFYQLLLSNDCPATPEQWLQRLLHQINRHSASPDQVHNHQLQQFVLSNNDIHQSLAERKRWLYSITPEENVLDGLQQWLEGKAPPPEQALLTYLSHHSSQQQPLQQWLHRALTNPRYLQRWLDDLSPETHQALLFPTLTSSALALLALRHAFCQLFESQKQGEHLFWQTLYRQHWLKGIAMTSSQLMHYVLIELNQLWVAHTYQGKTSHDISVAGLITRLLPLISTSSLRKTLVIKEHSLAQTTSRSESSQPGKQRLMAQLNHQQPEIKQLIDAIEIPIKDVKKGTEISREKLQDDAEISSESVTIYNAGLVIASTYIPMLFQRLSLTDGHKFVDIQAQHQALFCLQWMTNHTDSAPEYQLLLNKVLCGVAPSWPIPQQVLLSDRVKSIINDLLMAIIAHWKVLQKTSISGLQSTFIQREGLLTSTPKHWQLNIIPGTFDMLLDQLPWSFQTIKYPWMDKPLFVSWR
ncbi:contractile injection system tape measure protein [Pectobacterium polaris]|uniref:Uncharacterized protein n=1 Tax=Pectobacterium polaris TaxID=2042057 RepID=A0AAW5G8Q0_9GAMM|nr:contractile injection system tape measure protein [Pectobacterium polaris]MCL6350643.1 hypothetical protein [Pectobacterium polaris]MCL6368041.1 hypothetical protein [Pectobacterium polaris]